MPSLPAYVTAHAADAQQVVPALVALGPISGTTYRWTNFGRSIVALSETWTAAAVAFEGLSLNSYDTTECLLRLGDEGEVVTAADLAAAKGISGAPVVVYECWLNPTSFAVEATVKKFRGRVTLVTITDEGMSLVCGPYVNLAKKRLPRWTVSGNCPYVFRDARCGYAGADTTCLKTWADCGARTGGSNQLRFGGMRNLPAPGTKIIWTNGSWSLKGPNISPQPRGPAGPETPRRRRP